MTLSRKIIASIAVIGILYSTIRLFESGTGGGSLENAFIGVLFTVIALFVASLVSIIIHRKTLKERKDELIVFSFTSIVLIVWAVDFLST